MGLTRAQHAFTVAIATGRGLAVDVWGAQCHLWPHGGRRPSHSEPRSAQAVATTLVGDAPILCVDRPQRCAARGVRNARQAPHKAVRSFGSSRRSSFCRMPLAHGARWTENRPPPVDRGSLGRIRRVFERKPSPGSSPLHHRPRTRPLGEGSEEHVLLSNRESK